MGIRKFGDLSVIRTIEKTAEVPQSEVVSGPVITDEDDRDGEYEQREAYLERLGADIGADELVEEAEFDEPEQDVGDESSEEEYPVDDVIDVPIEVDTTEDEERDALLREIETLATYCNYTRRVIEHAKSLSLVDLREYMRIQRKHAGGSVTVAELIDATEEHYAEYMHSELLRRKVSILDAKGKDFLVLVQRLSATLGQDIALNGMKFREYHELLTHLVTHTSVVDNAVSSLAAILGIELPADKLRNDTTFPVIPGQAMTAKDTVYILQVIASNLTFYIEHALTLEKAYSKMSLECDKFKKERDTAKANEKDLLETTTRAIEQVEKTLARTASYVVMREEGYVGKRDPDEKLSVKNLDVYEGLADALFFTTKHAASDFVTRLDGRLGLLDVVRLVKASV